MSSYFHYLQEAIERTERLYLEVPNVAISQGKLEKEKRDRYFNLILDIVNKAKVEDITANCFSFNRRLKLFFKQTFNEELIYTIGYIKPSDKPPLFKVTEEEMISMLKNGHQDKELNLHAWLTFPTLEIIDSTFPTSAKYFEQTRRAIIFSHSSELIDVDYIPMLVGWDFLNKIGAYRFIV